MSSNSNIVIHVRSSSPMFPGEASQKARLWLKPGDQAQRHLAKPAMAQDLRGVDAVPGIAGRSPSYLVRQIYDFQQHARTGSGAALMAPVVEKLSHDDMISLAAYVSSLTP